MKHAIARLVIWTVAGVLLSMPAGLASRRYVSRAILRFHLLWSHNPQQIPSFDEPKLWEEIQENAFSETYLQKLAIEHQLYSGMHPPEMTKEIRRNIAANTRYTPRSKSEARGLTCCLFVGYADENPVLAESVTGALVTQLSLSTDGHPLLTAPVSDPCRGDGDCGGADLIEVLDPAQPAEPATPGIAQFATFGGALGLIAGTISESGRSRRPRANHRG
jgi:hypothetical protein